MTKYIPLYRPASFATLPRGLAWTYVEVPSYITTRPDLPTSEHTHGVIECRELTKEELAEFELLSTCAPEEVDSDGYPLSSPREWTEEELTELRRREYATSNYGSSICD